MFKKKISTKSANGRKYKLAMICLLAILAGFTMCAINPIFITVFNELVAGILSILFVYSSGNVGHTWAIGKKDSLTISDKGTKVYQDPQGTK